MLLAGEGIRGLVEIFYEHGVSSQGLSNNIVSLQTRQEEGELQSESSGLIMLLITGDNPTEARHFLLNRSPNMLGGPTDTCSR
jgi:hypothetical protein